MLTSELISKSSIVETITISTYVTEVKYNKNNIFDHSLSKFSLVLHEADILISKNSWFYISFGNVNMKLGRRISSNYLD